MPLRVASGPQGLPARRRTPPARSAGIDVSARGRQQIGLTEITGAIVRERDLGSPMPTTNGGVTPAT